MIIDTHSHLDGDEFVEDLNEVIARAKEAEVEKILLPAINVEGMQRLMQLCTEHPDYFIPMIGLHPEEVKEDYVQQLTTLHKI